MATKNQNQPSQRKEKGVFQRERALAKAKKRKQGNYDAA